MRFYIADLHFFHGNLNDKMDCRGFSSEEEMNRVMIERWNECVRKNDEVVILGDFSMGNLEQTNEILEQLHGTLYLLEGNHDRFLKDKSFTNQRFVWIKNYAEMHDNGRKVILSHYPMICYNGQYKKNRKGNSITYMLYGHVHNTEDEVLIRKSVKMFRETTRPMLPDGELQPIPSNLINCFCGFSNYCPLTLDDWIAKTEERNKEYGL